MQFKKIYYKLDKVNLMMNRIKIKSIKNNQYKCKFKYEYKYKFKYEYNYKFKYEYKYQPQCYA